MRLARLIATLILALALVALMAPVAPAAAQPTSESPLLEALAYAPLGSDGLEVSFIDWAELKRLHGGEDVSGTSPVEERRRLSLDIARSEASTVSLGLDLLGPWSDHWGWDKTDLEWEARIWDGFRPAVFRFSEDWDAGAFTSALDDAGYVASPFASGTHYLPDDGTEVPESLRLMRVFGLERAHPGDPPQARVAVSRDARTVVVSPFEDGTVAQEVLVTRERTDPASVAASPMGRVAAALGRPVSARLLDGQYGCSGTGEENQYFSGDAAVVAASVAPLHPYEALAAGYSRREPGAPAVGRYVFAYEEPSQAEADVAGRRVLIEDGSPWPDYPSPGKYRYSDVAFTLVDTRTGHGQLILDVAPLGDSPKLVFDQVIRPTSFAMCGPVPAP